MVSFGAAHPARPMEQGPWQALRRGGCTNPATSSLFPPSFYRTLTPGGHSANPLGTAGRTGTLKPFKPWRGTDPICTLHALQALGSPPAPRHPLPNLLPPRAHLQPSAPHGSPLSLHFFPLFHRATAAAAATSSSPGKRRRGARRRRLSPGSPRSVQGRYVLPIQLNCYRLVFSALRKHFAQPSPAGLAVSRQG